MKPLATLIVDFLFNPSNASNQVSVLNHYSGAGRTTQNKSLAMVLIPHGVQFFLTTAVGGFLCFKNKYCGITRLHAVPVPQSTSNEETDDHLLLQATRLQVDQLSRDLGILPKKKRQIES